MTPRKRVGALHKEGGPLQPTQNTFNFDITPVIQVDRKSPSGDDGFSAGKWREVFSEFGLKGAADVIKYSQTMSLEAACEMVRQKMHPKK